MCKKLIFLTSFVVVLGLAGSASAQLIAYEPFDYPANGLSGNDGGSGWNGAWDGGDQQVTAPGLAFSPLLVKGNKATVAGNETDSFRNLPEPMGDNETQLWISFVGQADQQPGANMWGGVSFHEPDESLFLGVPWQEGDGDKVWGLDTKGDGNRFTEIPITEKIIFVARVDFNTDGDNETVTAWAKSINDTDPLDLTDETAFAQYTTRNIEFSRVRVAGNQPVNIDEIRLSMTPEDVLGLQQVDMEIGFAAQPPVIDGEVDETWADASTQYLVPVGEPANASGSWKALYDSENLYVIVDISDDILMNDSDSSWQDDSVEFYFDGGNTKDGPPLSGDNRQYTFGWTTDDIQGVNTQLEGVEHAQVDTDTGWRIEIKLPWLSLQDTEPQAGDLIGIDCFYNDDDDGGDTSESQIFTFATATQGGAWNDASQWGTAMLTAVTEPEPANPVHRYTFEDGTANDSVGSAHGTLVGDAAVTDGALVTYDQDDWMEMPGDVIAMNTFDEVTIEAWYTPTAGANAGWSMLAYFGDSLDGLGSNGFFITSARADDKSRAAISIGDIATPWASETGADGPEYDDGLLHHMVSTINATDITLYIDGELIASTPLDPNNSISGISQNFAYLAKGGYGGDPEWIGSIQEFNIYNMALSPGQVAAKYAAGPVRGPVHSYTFEDGTANDSVGSAHGTLVGDATVVDGQLVLDGDGDWMDMPGDVIAMNTFEGLTIEIMFTSVAGGNTGFHMVTAFGEEGTGDNPGFGYKYVCITPARGDDVSRGMIQTVSMDNDPWSEETGVSDVIEHDDGLPHHMVCTVDNTELAFYVDGVLIGTAALDPPGNSIAGIGTDAAHIGKGVYGVDPLWAGSVEEFNIYDYALSPGQVAAKYAAGPQKVGPAPVDPGTEGLMLHLPLDTASRGVTQDSSENDRDGTLFGDPTFVEGVVIMALDFDGIDDVVELGKFDVVGQITMAAWVKADDFEINDARIISKANEWGGDNHWWMLSTISETGLRFRLKTDEGPGTATLISDPVLEAGVWAHVVATWDGSMMQIYKDGIEVASQEKGGSAVAVDPAISVAIGSQPSDAFASDPSHVAKFFDGLIDEVMIYDRALSAEEILYLAGM